MIKRFITEKFRFQHFSAPACAGFTIVELMAVIAGIVLLMGLVAPAFNGIGSNQSFAGSVGGVSSVLQEARVYAMAHHTHVFVGITEVAANQSTAASKQIPGQGRVVMAVVASRDGTSIYGTIPSNWTSNYGVGASLVAISALQHFDNVHLTDQIPNPAIGGLSRPTVPENDQIAAAATQWQTPFSWPLGTALNAGQYNFQQVIEFNSQGSARIQTTNNVNTLPEYLEIGVQQTRGTMVISGSNVAAIQVGGINGDLNTYRP